MKALPAILTVFFLLTPTRAQYSGGTGEPNDPYQIATAEDLMLLGESPEDYDKHFILTADIDLDPDLSGRKIFDRAVIAPDRNPSKEHYQGTSFTGTFDGNGKTIRHLTIAGRSHLGLFGVTGFGGRVSNLALKNVDVRGARGHVGGMVGLNYGSVATSCSTGAVSGSGAKFAGVGGLAGSNRGCITVCYSTCFVDGDRSVGGLVGDNDRGNITACYSTGTVSGNEYVGGLVGYDRYGPVTASFWNMESSGQTASASGQGKTSDEMRDIGTYLSAGWDFVDEIFNGTSDYWKISRTNYPQLRSHLGEDPVMLEGSGTVHDPYLIRDVWDLGTVWLKPAAHYRLEASVDLSGVTWSMAVVPWFEGTFDGNGRVITNLSIQGVGYVGLFGRLEPGAEVKNIALVDVSVAGSGEYVGGLAGSNRGDLTACYSTGTVEGSEHVGGLAGSNGYNGTMISCYSAAAVTGDRSSGGLAGRNFGIVSQCCSASEVSGYGPVGGLMGHNHGTVTLCRSAGTVSSKGDSVGGLVGSNYNGQVTNCYSSGAASGNAYVGGLVGLNHSTVAYCYSTGAVSGELSVGGLVGQNGGDVTASFWNVQTSGQMASTGGTGLTTAEMHNINTYLDVGWNFFGEIEDGLHEIWRTSLNHEYPRFVWESKPLGGPIPYPPDGIVHVAQPVVLRWLIGEDAVHYDIYIGEDEQAVANATPDSAGIYRGRQPREVTTHDAGTLEWGKTYYWRIDHVNGPPDHAVKQGVLWAFRTEPIAYPIRNITATASSMNNADMGPEKSVDGSGLDHDNLHSKEPTDMWLSANEPNGAWIEFQFDRVYRLHEMWVWNSNQIGEPFLDFGFKRVKIEYSTDGIDWRQPDGISEFAQAPGTDGYAHNTIVDLAGIVAKYIRLSVLSNWGVLPHFGLSEVRFFYVPARAREPVPHSTATGVGLVVTLNWRSGVEADMHDVYFSTDEQAVMDGTAPVATVTETSYGPVSLDLDTTYYWKINEVNTFETPTTWESAIWNFTTLEFLIVDDFESYNELDPGDPESKRIFETWIDGFGTSTNGALIGFDLPPYVWRIVAHTGKQSMPFLYNNSGPAYYSEGTAEVSNLSVDQDWTLEGVSLLSLWLKGNPNNDPESIYVAISDAKGSLGVAHNDDPNATQKEEWTEWIIDLREFVAQGVDLTDLDSISIGFGDKNNPTPGGSGAVHFDDIRLYRQ